MDCHKHVTMNWRKRVTLHRGPGGWSLAAAVALCCAAAGAAELRLVAHWKLSGDARDASGHERHGVNHGASLQPPAAQFDGRDDRIEIPRDVAPRLGTGEFSLALWARLEPDAVDVPGTLLSQWDPAHSRGFQFGISHHAGVTTNQSNQRQVHFGINQGRVEPNWTDHGQLGNATLVFALAVHDGQLFAGTCEAGAAASGRVFRWGEGQTWADCGSPHPCNSVSSLAVHDGQLYAGVSKYRLAGSALPESQNPHLGGRVYRYDGDKNWTDCGQLPGVEAIGGLVEFGGRLYATSLYRPAGFFRYEGGQQWTSLEVPNEKRVEALAVYNGQLFASSYDQGHVFRYDGKTWTDCGQVGPPENTQTYSFAVYHGQLYVGTWRTGRVYRYAGDDDWFDAGRLGEELEVMGMLVHNGTLFAGSLPLAQVYRYQPAATWELIGQLDATPDVMYRRAWTMAEYQGRLFCGTLPGGRVFSLQSGRCVTYDKALSDGWHHLAAVRDTDRLRLYVDGRPVANSTTFAPQDFDLQLDQPWQLGFGATDYFQGRLSDVRVYDRALAPADVARLYADRSAKFQQHDSEPK